MPSTAAPRIRRVAVDDRLIGSALGELEGARDVVIAFVDVAARPGARLASVSYPPSCGS